MRRPAPLLACSLVALGLGASGCVELRRKDESRGAEVERGRQDPQQGGSQGDQQGDEGRAEPRAQDSASRYQPNEAGAEVHALPARFAPLTRIVGKGAFPFQSKTSISTLGDACYTPDLARWLQAHPPGGPLYEAVLRHEQLHAQRQAGGVDPWLDRYLKDTRFMWEEEQLGWYEQLRFLKERGLRLDAQAVARNLSKYSNLSGSMISYDQALKWTEDVLAGRWRPAGQSGW